MTDQTNGSADARKPPLGNGKAKLARIPLAPMYERTDKRGRRYLSGRLGLLRLLVFRTNEVSEGDPVWEAVIVEGNHINDSQRALAAQTEEVAP